MSHARINLDHSAATPLLPEVTQVMAALEEGNPSSIHQSGRQAAQRLEQARTQAAGLINAKPADISFTSCGTESNNWALRGLFAANRRKGNHIVISAIEHPSVSLSARRLEVESNARVTILPVDRDGMVSPSDLKAALTPETVLVSIMLANGEVGTIEPIKELAAVAHEHGALFHTDAIAAAGHWPIDVKALGVDALSLAANQFYGPSGAAVLFVRDGVRILPLLEGGGQEQGGRSGTEALSAIVGLAAAAGVAKRDLPQRIEQVRVLRNRLHDGLKERIEGLRISGPLDFRRVARSGGPQPPERTTPIVRRREDGWGRAATGPVESHEGMLRLPQNLHICVDGVASESLVLGLDMEGIAAGLGSACNAKAMRPSHVLKAMGLTDEQAKGALVLSVGVMTTDEEIDRALDTIPTVVQRLRHVTALTSRA